MRARSRATVPANDKSSGLAGYISGQDYAQIVCPDCLAIAPWDERPYCPAHGSPDDMAAAAMSHTRDIVSAYLPPTT